MPGGGDFKGSGPASCHLTFGTKTGKSWGSKSFKRAPHSFIHQIFIDWGLCVKHSPATGLSVVLNTAVFLSPSFPGLKFTGPDGGKKKCKQLCGST